jgi:hypothetical protein
MYPQSNSSRLWAASITPWIATGLFWILFNFTHGPFTNSLERKILIVMLGSHLILSYLITFAIIIPVAYRLAQAKRFSWGWVILAGSIAWPILMIPALSFIAEILLPEFHELLLVTLMWMGIGALSMGSFYLVDQISLWIKK